MRVPFISTLATVVLVIAAIIWLLQEQLGKLFGIRTRDNCFTWAARNWRYRKDQFIAIGKSQSAWFPHVRIYRETESGIEQVEYVPKIRENLTIPPSKFDGYVTVTKFTKGDQ